VLRQPHLHLKCTRVSMIKSNRRIYISAGPRLIQNFSKNLELGPSYMSELALSTVGR
jgi:hypothetical protein